MKRLQNYAPYDIRIEQRWLFNWTAVWYETVCWDEKKYYSTFRHIVIPPEKLKPLIFIPENP